MIKKKKKALKKVYFLPASPVRDEEKTELFQYVRMNILAKSKL